MECVKCGAEIPEGAETCPECAEPVAAAPEAVAVTDTEPEAVAVTDTEPEAAAVTDTEPEAAAVTSRAPKSGSAGKTIGIAAAVLVVLALIAGGVWWGYSRVAASNSPEGAATAMLKAYAAYDAAGILDTATHKSLPADGVKEFEKQASEAKTRAGGKPGVKDFKVISVKMDGADQATVKIEALWLTDPAKGTYTKRTEDLTCVKQDGKWLVKLF